MTLTPPFDYSAGSWLVPGRPIGQPRATPIRRGKHSWMIEAPSDHAIHLWKAAVREEVRGSEKQPEGVPLALYLTFIFDRPQRLLNKPGFHLHVVKPDCDNLAKAVQDACNGLLWHDDRQICKLVVEKRYCHVYEAAGVHIHLSKFTVN